MGGGSKGCGRIKCSKGSSGNVLSLGKVTKCNFVTHGGATVERLEFLVFAYLL